ncbi:hypothetical protein Lal_00045400, partial [Lupinus albus]
MIITLYKGRNCIKKQREKKKMGWSRGHIIGHGSSAMVYLATSDHSSSSASTTSISAVKSWELSRSEHLQREQKILSSLSSPYIVTYKGYDITTENNTLFYNLFMEYMPFGTLTQSTLRHHHGGRINEPVIAHYTRQVLQGLEYLHSKRLVHCDIKGSNILVNEDGAKISDFGCAKYVNNNELPPGAAAVISGTPMFMSPEVARGQEQGYPCDIWALGCTMVEIATGFAPWPNVEDPVSILYHIAYSNEVPKIPSFLSNQAKDFLGKCFMRNPKERWSASQLLKHPFLVEFNSKGKQILESNSCSPTSILDQGFWNSVEESECHFGNNLVRTSFENSAAGRIRGLALRSGDPDWTWDDKNWVTTIGNNEAVAEAEACDYGLFDSETRNYCMSVAHEEGEAKNDESHIEEGINNKLAEKVEWGH